MEDFGSEAESLWQDSLGEDVTRRQGEVLICLESTLSAAVCAEPAIRSLKNKLGRNWQIYVTGENADLYHFHPSVAGFSQSLETADTDRFCHSYSIRPLPDPKRHEIDPVVGCFMQLGLEPKKISPELHFGDEDAAGLVELGILDTSHPRVGFAPGPESGHDGTDTLFWNELGRILKDTVGAGLVQLSGEMLIQDALNAAKKARNIRDIAVSLEACDVLITEMNGIAHLAAATETPRVILYGHGCPHFYRHNGESAVVNTSGLQGRDLLAAVIDTVVDLVGNTKRNE